jgi:hypothetical protein
MMGRLVLYIFPFLMIQKKIKKKNSKMEGPNPVDIFYKLQIG